MEAFLSQYPAEIQTLALKIRALILEATPDAVETVDAPSNLIAYGYGTKYADLVCGIMPYRAHVNLIFARGTSLADPDGLLQGTGKKARHVKIQSQEQVGDQRLRRLVVEAFKAMKR